MRVRFTVRRIMVAVALAAVAVAGFRWVAAMRYRSQMYQVDADYHDIYSKYAEVRSKSYRFGVEKREAARETAAWHAGRRNLYKEAAARPWRDVPPAKEPRID